MTVTYTGDVANARLCAFSRLLFRWKGSVYKLLYKEMLIFCTLYFLLSLIYRVILNEQQRRVFEQIVLYCEIFINLIPLSFVLGFYVAIVVTRWWNQYVHIPWPDRVMLYVTTMIDGADEQSRLVRRTIMRYLTLGSLIVFQATSIRIKKRFPTMEHLIEAGVVTRTEVAALDEISTPHGKWWVPFIWCGNLLKDARRHGRIQDNYLLKTLVDEIQEYRGNLGMLYAYDWISVPLVYTQVTTLAVYTFFLGCTFGRQFIDPAQNHPGHTIDLYFPLFTFLQFFFYMGWLKVAEQLINPFGEDDDDYEMNWIIDRNMQVSLLVADDLYGQFPQVEKDIFFGEPPPDFLPYTRSSVKGMSLPHMGSTADVMISDEGMKVLTVLETIQEGVALGGGTQGGGPGGPSHLPSYLGTPKPAGTPTTGSPPQLIPADGNPPVRYLNQNPMSCMRSPNVMSHASLQSCRDFELGGTAGGAGRARAGSSVIRRATEKLGNWLIHHSSRVDLNPPGSAGIGVIGGQFSAGGAGFVSRQVDDRDSLRTCDSIRDLDDVVATTTVARAINNLSPRLSPVAEMICSRSAPVRAGGEHFPFPRGGGGREERAENGDLQEGVSSAPQGVVATAYPHGLHAPIQTWHAGPEDRFSVTPHRVAASRSDSATHDVAGSADEPAKELQLDEFIELNLQELNPDRDSLSVPPSAVPSIHEIVIIDPGSSATDPIRVRWSSHTLESSNRREMAPAYEGTGLVDFTARPQSFATGFSTTGFAGGVPRLADASSNESPAGPSCARVAAPYMSRTNILFRSIGDANSHNNKTTDVVRFDPSGTSMNLGFQHAVDSEFRNGSAWVAVSEIQEKDRVVEGVVSDGAGNSWCSSGEGLEYEPPEPNQCTVSSLTPLLSSSCAEEGEGGSGKDSC